MTPKEDTPIAHDGAVMIKTYQGGQDANNRNDKDHYHQSHNRQIDSNSVGLHTTNVDRGGKYTTHHKSKSDCKSVSVSADGKEERTKKSKSGFNLLLTMPAKQRWILFLITMAMFWARFCFSLLGPFFPTEATKKGMSMATVGIVYGIFEGVIFITSPFFGSYLVRLGPRFVMFTGIFVAGSCNILFGSLKYCPDGIPYIVMCILLRCVEAFGCSGFMTACYAFVSSEFNENIGFTFGILETAAGLAFMLGPTIGAGLFQLGGFGLPFYFAGVAVLLNGIAMYALLPILDEPPKKRKGSTWALLGNPMVVIPACSVFVGTVGISAYDGTFAKHLEPMGYSVGIVGIFFAVLSVIHSVTSIIWGYLSDTKNIQAPLIVVGHAVLALGMLIIGPSILLPFIPFSLGSTITGLGCMGVSYGCTLIPTIKCMVNGAIEMGLEDSLDTYALVSGLFTSLMTLGAFVGPIGVGRLIDEFGFPIAYTVPGILNLVMAVVTLILFAHRYHRKGNSYNNNQ